MKIFMRNFSAELKLTNSDGLRFTMDVEITYYYNLLANGYLDIVKNKFYLREDNILQCILTFLYAHEFRVFKNPAGTIFFRDMS